MTVPATRSDPILNVRDGYGRNATGGAAGEVYHVTNLNDSGPGSLRYGAESTDPLWIVFDQPGTIAPASFINVGSNKTIDGRGQAVTLLGFANIWGILNLDGSNNVIITNLAFDGGVANWDVDSEGEDCIKLIGASDVFIYRNSFTHPSDGAIDSPELSQRVTISQNKFTEIFQGINLTADKVTFARNWAVNVRLRFPKIIDGWLHAVNNVCEASWTDPEILCAKKQLADTAILSDYCYWKAGTYKHVGKKVTGGLINYNNRYGVNGVIWDGGDDNTSSTLNSEARALVTMQKPSTAADWTAFVAGIKANAGPV